MTLSLIPGQKASAKLAIANLLKTFKKAYRANKPETAAEQHCSRRPSTTRTRRGNALQQALAREENGSPSPSRGVHRGLFLVEWALVRLLSVPPIQHSIKQDGAESRGTDAFELEGAEL